MAEQNETVAGPVLSPEDIENAVRVMDYAAEQGALKGWNAITQVLQLRSRFVAFLEAYRAANPAPETPEGETGSEG